jgi:CDP-diacylglycerol--serine O-phosphatidyltransferase
MRIPRVSILASLCTLGNALCGFGAVTVTTKALLISGEAHSTFCTDIKWAGYLVLLAMVFDALDGRLARFARATSDFGGQLDSLADAISFGVAPAFLMNRVVVEGLHDVLLPTGLVEVLRLAWVCGAVYLGCALIRLARFNVENVHDEEAHLSFRGLPSPAAAGTLVSVIIVLTNVWPESQPGTTAAVILWGLPVLTVALGLLMVANVRYLHVLNQFIRGRRPVTHLIPILLAIALVFLLREVTLPVGFGAYMLSGPVWTIGRRIGDRRRIRRGLPPRTFPEPPPGPTRLPPQKP